MQRLVEDVTPLRRGEGCGYMLARGIAERGPCPHLSVGPPMGWARDRRRRDAIDATLARPPSPHADLTPKGHPEGLANVQSCNTARMHRTLRHTLLSRLSLESLPITRTTRQGARRRFWAGGGAMAWGR